LSLRIAQHGKILHERLTQANVLCDWREPDVIRVAPAPLYNTFMEVYSFVNHLVAAHTDIIRQGS
jgi:kynureninase